MTSIPQCPFCGGTTVQYRYATSTLMGYSQIIKDGEWQIDDPNWHTSHYTCVKCHHRFHIREQYGRTVEVIDDGEEQQVPVSKISLTAPKGATETITIQNTNTCKVPETKYKWELDIEELKRQLKEVQETLKKFEMSVKHEHIDMVETTKM